jgi:SAM-dependent methyltransferase
MTNKNCCWLCHSTADKITDVAEPIYFHCPSCDLIFIDHNYLLSPENEKARYQLHNNTIENDGYVKYLKQFIDSAITPLNLNLKNGLDFGCGPTPVLSMLLSQNGIDMDWYDPFFYPDKKFINKKYDLITVTEVLEHVHNPEKIMALLKKHLKPKGILAIMTHFYTGQNFKNWWYRQDKTHVCFYRAETFRWIEKHYNFNIILADNQSICVLQHN